MRCRECERKLSSLLDGRLDEEARVAVEEHIKECAPCRRSYELLRASERALAAQGPAPVDPGLADRAVEAAFAATPGAARPPADQQPAGLLDGLLALKWPAVATAAAAVLIAAVLALVAGLLDGSGRRSPGATDDPVVQVASVSELGMDRISTVAAMLAQEEEE